MADLVFKKDILPLVKKDLCISSSNTLSHTSGRKALRENTIQLETDEAFFCYGKYRINESLVSVIFVIMPKSSAKDVHIPKEINETEGVYFLELYQFTNSKYCREIYMDLFNENRYGIASLNLDYINLFLTSNCDVMSLHNSLKSNTKDFYDSRNPYRRGKCTIYVEKNTKFKFDTYLLEKESCYEFEYRFINNNEIEPLCDAKFKIENGVLLSCTPCKSIVVPQGVKEIKSNVFKDKLFKTVKLNYGLEILDDCWFEYPTFEYDNISVINMPSTIKRIGDYALPTFYNLKFWVSRKADESEVGEWIHGIDYGETTQRYYALPYDLEYISPNAFIRERGSYEKVFFVNDKHTFDINEKPEDDCLTSEGKNFVLKYSNNGDSLLYTKDFKKLVLVFSHAGRKNTKQIALQEGVEIIEKGAFDQVKVEEIVCPSTLKEIEPGAFDYSHIKRIIVRNNETMYGDDRLSEKKKINVYNGFRKKKEVEITMDLK